VLFEFAESRSGAHPLNFLRDYDGYLQPNSGHDALYRTGRIIEVGCWAHCRRRFFEIAKAQRTPRLAAQALAWIAKLYAIGSGIKDKSPEHKLAARQALLSRGKLTVPFEAEVRKRSPTSPLGPGDRVQVIAMAPEDVCETEAFVWIRWNKRKLAVPLAQRVPLASDEMTQQAIAYWQYWRDRGYQL